MVIKKCTSQRYMRQTPFHYLSDITRILCVASLSVLILGCSSGGESKVEEFQATPPSNDAGSVAPPPSSNIDDQFDSTPLGGDQADKTDEETTDNDDTKDNDETNDSNETTDSSTHIKAAGAFKIFDIDDESLNFKANYFWQNVYDYPDTVAISDFWTFELDEHVLSFALVFEGENAGDRFERQTSNNIFFSHQSTISRVITPDGQSLPLEDYVFCQEHLCSMVIPNTVSGNPINVEGEWKVQLAVAVDDVDAFTGDVADYNVTVLSRSVAETDETDESKIYVQPYLASTLIDKSVFNDKIEVYLAQLVAENDLPIEILEAKVLSAEEYGAVSYRFTNSLTSEMVKTGNRYAVNVFFIDEFLDLPIGLSGVLGISGGIPGPLGLKSANNGVMLPIGAFYRSDVGLSDYDVENIASTALHEIGHFLGLFHTTEATGTLFDLIDDTPECGADLYDTNNNGYISIFECRGIDADNIMFFQTGTDQQFSPQQIEVLKRSPIARISPPGDDE